MKHSIVLYPSADGLGANPSVLHPVPPLTIQRAVLHQPTLAANQSTVLLRLHLCTTTVLDAAIATPLAGAITAPLALESILVIVVKVNVAVDPIAHVS